MTGGWAVFVLAALLAAAPCLLVLGGGNRAAPAVGAMRRCAASPLLCAAWGFCTALLMSVAAARIRPPHPQVHDEFSYRLGGETFALGRATNPSLPSPAHFETPHVLLEPGHASKYPPGQALTLAAGIRLFGSALAGVQLAFACACAALAWGLRGWLRPRAALAATALAATHAGFHSDVLFSWSRSYWGGGVALAGGALLLGALPRLLRRPSAPAGFALGAGASILASSRPFEGLVLCAAVALPLARAWLRQGRHALLPAVAAVVPAVAGLAGLLLHNAAVTGDAATFPYVLYERQFARAPLFAFQDPAPPKSYRSEAVRRYHEIDQLQVWRRQQGVHAWIRECARKTGEHARYFGPPLALCLLGWPLGFRHARIAALAASAVGLATLLSCWSLPHYLAPAVPLLFAAAGAGLARLAARSRPLALTALLAPLLLTAWKLADPPVTRRALFGRERARVEAELEALPGRDLVFVRTPPGHPRDLEWVYNGADLSTTGVVWARAVGREEDAALRELFPDRTAWIVEAGTVPALLLPVR